MRLYHAFLTLWVRFDESVVSNQPQVEWPRTDMRSVRDFPAPCLSIEPLGELVKALQSIGSMSRTNQSRKN